MWTALRFPRIILHSQNKHEDFSCLWRMCQLLLGCQRFNVSTHSLAEEAVDDAAVVVNSCTGFALVYHAYFLEFDTVYKSFEHWYRHTTDSGYEVTSYSYTTHKTRSLIVALSLGLCK